MESNHFRRHFDCHPGHHHHRHQRRYRSTRSMSNFCEHTPLGQCSRHHRSNVVRRARAMRSPCTNRCSSSDCHRSNCKSLPDWCPPGQCKHFREAVFSNVPQSSSGRRSSPGDRLSIPDGHHVPSPFESTSPLPDTIATILARRRRNSNSPGSRANSEGKHSVRGRPGGCAPMTVAGNVVHGT